MFHIGLDLSLSDSGMCILDSKGKVVLMKSYKSERFGDTFQLRCLRYEGVLKAMLTDIYNILKGCLFTCAIEMYAFGAKGRNIQLAEFGFLIRHYVRKETDGKDGNYADLIFEVAPASMKKFILGAGSTKNKEDSSKAVIIREIYKKYGIDINNDNIADAFVLSHISQLYWKKVFNTKLDSEGKKQKVIKGFAKYQHEVVDNIISKISKERTKLIKKIL